MNKYLFNPFIQIVLSVWILISIWGCPEDPETPCMDATNPDCQNYDPCLGHAGANAEFVMVDSFKNFYCTDIPGSSYYYSDRDTCINNRIYLRASQINDTYKWIIGKDSSYPQARSFPFDLPNNFPSDTIKIQLITSRQSPDECGLIERDTVVKTLYRIDVDWFGSSWSLVIGSFRGVDLDNPTDSFTITIPPIFPTFQGIDNFPNGCVGQYHEVETRRHGFNLMTTSTVCHSFCGTAVILQDRKTLVIDYSVVEGNQRKLKRWIGTKTK